MFKNSSAEMCPEICRNFHIWKNLQYVLPNYLAFLQVKATLGFAAVPIVCYRQGESAVLSFPVYSTICAVWYGTCLCSQLCIENLSNYKSTFSPRCTYISCGQPWSAGRIFSWKTAGFLSFSFLIDSPSPIYSIIFFFIFKIFFLDDFIGISVKITLHLSRFFSFPYFFLKA